MKRVILAILLASLLMAFVGCRANQSAKTTTQNNSKTVTKVQSPEESKKAVEKSTDAAKKAEVHLTTIDAQLESIGDFDIVDESGLD